MNEIKAFLNNSCQFRGLGRFRFLRDGDHHVFSHIFLFNYEYVGSYNRWYESEEIKAFGLFLSSFVVVRPIKDLFKLEVV